MNILKNIFKAQLQISPWAIAAVIIFSILYSNLKVGVYFGIVALMALNLTYLIYYFFIKDKD